MAAYRSYRKTGPRDPTRCNAVLDFPRVAMMFLSAGEQHHEETWRDWFRDIGGLVPRENLQVRHKQLALAPRLDNRQQPEDTWGQQDE
jgi:hypothetical protein